jgi:hypothetical protein
MRTANLDCAGRPRSDYQRVPGVVIGPDLDIGLARVDHDGQEGSVGQLGLTDVELRLLAYCQLCRPHLLGQKVAISPEYTRRRIGYPRY